MEESTAPLRVPTEAIVVDIAMHGEPARALDLFVGSSRFHAWRGKQVAELLERSHRFLPVHDRATDGVVLVNTERVLWVSVPAAMPSVEEASEDDFELYDVSRAVRVELHASDPLEGQLLFGAQERGTRVLDYLNAAGRFLRLWRDDRLYLIQRAFVTRVVEIRAA
jgi:hypothetical protein